MNSKVRARKRNLSVKNGVSDIEHGNTNKYDLSNKNVAIQNNNGVHDDNDGSKKVLVEFDKVEKIEQSRLDTIRRVFVSAFVFFGFLLFCMIFFTQIIHADDDYDSLKKRDASIESIHAQKISGINSDITSTYIHKHRVPNIMYFTYSYNLLKAKEFREEEDSALAKNMRHTISMHPNTEVVFMTDDD